MLAAGAALPLEQALGIALILRLGFALKGPALVDPAGEIGGKGNIG